MTFFLLRNITEDNIGIQKNIKPYFLVKNKFILLYSMYTCSVIQILKTYIFFKTALADNIIKM